MLMNAFDKKLVFAFYNLFLKIELSCDKENHVSCNTSSFQKKMLCKLACVLIYSLTKYALEDSLKDSCVMKVL